MKSVGLSFFGLSAKDLAVFDRVIEFVAKKGKKFHHCSAESATIFIVNDDAESIRSAQQQQQSQIMLCIGNIEDEAIADYIIKRPLLITRVMRALEQAADQWKKQHPEDNSINEKIDVTEKPKTSKNTPKSKPKTTTDNERGEFHALVVDDSAAIRKQLELELRGSSITADYAVCGEDALKKINKTQYDIIFLDIIMPDIYGYEVCKQLRKKPNYKRTPVIMLSGKTAPLDEVEGILAGATTYLKKPVKHKDFQKTLTRLSRWLCDYA
jgi:CheY-like chemotaxis protein